ncbi:nucleotide exchange factor GrpE [Deinococcus psychrotolerans]|uniref:Protein GrpE n=1 Tax=Deinococcus psychrotolerans TaxID=2489213 RepID=A0A3G8YLU2_9DEIO|nr:nucleotide exchange factor GrpE [Deinococcus psychrotolerans]AZI43564.1 nucleotide exchange factor GrpE [Deinococcus psychrotolerans]
MTNKPDHTENLKFEPETKTGEQTLEAVDAQPVDAELLDEDADMEGLEGMDGMPDLDENMFAQVQEMMAKMEKVDELEKENADLRGRLGRLAADFESHRRRTQDDVSGAQDQGKAKAAEAMMPIYDALERALTMGTEDPVKLIPGVQAVQASVLRVFSGLGLEATGSVGEHFDPQWHEALQVVPGDENDIITQVYELGFKMGDKLVRPARVVVSKKQ